MSSDSSVSNQNDVKQSRQVGRMIQIALVLTATLLHTIFLSKAKPLQSANDRSRWCTIWSVVERGTFQIDEIRQRPGWDTIDLVRVDDHYYSTKPPLLTSVLAGLTWCIQRVTGWRLYENVQPVTFVVLLISNIIPFFVALLAWMAILERISTEPWTRFFALLIAAFATLLTPFLMTLNNHTVAAASAMIAVYAMLKILDSSEYEGRIWPYALCGVATGWTIANELPAAACGLFFFLLALRCSVWKTLTYFVFAALIPIAALIATNVVVTGSWKPTYADYGSDKYRFIVDGVPSYWMNPQGVDRNIDSPLTYFLHCTIGHHGIFSLTPIALMAIAGWLLSIWQKDRVLRSLLLMGACTSAIVLAFYMTRTQNYNYGGVSCGLRWALWLTPLWLVAVVPILDFCSKFALGRGLAILLASISVYSAWQPIDNPWRQPWLFQWMDSRGWINYSDEREQLKRPLWTWFSTLPETSDDAPAWIEFKIAQPSSSARYLKLTGRTHLKGMPNEYLEVDVQETVGDAATPLRTRSFRIETRQFNDAASPADFMRWSDPNVTSAQQLDDLAFVRGLPRKVAFELRSIRYLKTPLRKEAIRCQHVTAHVSFAANDGDIPITYRCEAWLTDEVPFGAVRVEFHMNQSDDAGVLLHERWTVHDCWPKIQPYKNLATSP